MIEKEFNDRIYTKRAQFENLGELVKIPIFVG